MERVVERPNLLAGTEASKENKGSPGIDGMTVEELQAYLWAALGTRSASNCSRGPTSPCRSTTADSEDGGGERELGIPTVLDR